MKARFADVKSRHPGAAHGELMKQLSALWALEKASAAAAASSTKPKMSPWQEQDELMRPSPRLSEDVEGHDSHEEDEITWAVRKMMFE